MNNSIEQTTDNTNYTENLVALYKIFLENICTDSSIKERLTTSSSSAKEYESQKRLEKTEGVFAEELIPFVLNDEFEYGINAAVDVFIRRYSGASFEEKLTLGKGYESQKRLEKAERMFAKELISLILNDEFEYGIDTKADAFVRRYMDLDPLLTKEWINAIFIDNFADVFIIVGLLRIIARLDYTEIFPQGQTMALAALSHENTEVKECGVRAYESWGTIDSLNELEHLKVGIQWLQEYIDDVVWDLKKEHDVLIHQKDK